jgi:hypothetical protein
MPPTEDELFGKVQAVFEMDPNGKQAQGALPVSGDHLIRRKAIGFLSQEQRQKLASERKTIAIFNYQSDASDREVKRSLRLVPPQTPILDLINYQVLMVKRELIFEVLSSLSYQEKITLLYHYRNDSNLLEAVRFRSRLFKRIKELY